MFFSELLIDGHFFGGPCDQGIGKEPIYRPYEGMLLGAAAEAGWSEVEAAIFAADRAFRDWSQSPRRDRIQLLRRIAASLRERQEELAQLVCLEVGKPITLARSEVSRGALTFDLAADGLSQSSGEVLPADVDGRGDGVRITVERFPIGPILAISPYNWPINLAAHKIAPALAAGCTVVLKGSPLAALSTGLLARIIHEAGCPAGVLNCIHCVDALAEKAVRDSRLEVISFTGSDRVGHKIREAASDRKLILELGGDATAILMPGAELGSALDKCAASAYSYAGQVCISLQRLLVHDSIYDSVRAQLIKKADDFPTGNPSDDSVLCGPMISDDAADRVMAFIEDSGSVLSGGSRIGRLITPTLIENPTGRLNQDEAFGPILALHRINCLEEGIKRINSSRYGLQASIFTGNIREAERAYQELDVGAVIINDTPSLRFDLMPYGGVKASGTGREGPSSAFLEYTQPRVRVERF